MKKNKFCLIPVICILLSLFCMPLQVLAQNQTLLTNNLSKPEIIGQSAITMDINTGEIIYTKDIDTKKYPASITKLMTALIFSENAKKDSKIPFTQSAKEQPEYSLNVNYGPIEFTDSLSGSDAMNALLLFSANDVAYMIGDYVSGSSDEFLKLMNKKAKELGMNNTNFENLNGLHNNEHYSTAYDLALMGKAILKNPWVTESISIKTSQIQFMESEKRIDIKNRNKLLGENGNIGGKTGYTTPAGRCLLAFYERDGRKLVGVVLNSEYDATDTQVFDDMNTIMDYSFAAEKSIYKKAGEVISTVEAKYKPFRFFGKEKIINIPLILNTDILKYDNGIQGDDVSLVPNIQDLNTWDLASNNEIPVSFIEKENSLNLTASSSITKFDIIKANLLYYSIIIGLFIVGIILILWIIFTFKNKTRRRRNFFKRKKGKNIFS